MTVLIPITPPTEPIRLPLFLSMVSAGFPSPADDYFDGERDLMKLLVQDQNATFFCRVTGDSMEDAGIFDGDILIVERAAEAAHGDVVVAAVGGELTCKYLDKNRRRLLPANKAYHPIEITEGSELVIEGVVRHSIRCHTR